MKMEILELLDMGFEKKKVAEMCGCSLQTVYNYIIERENGRARAKELVGERK